MRRTTGVARAAASLVGAAFALTLSWQSYAAAYEIRGSDPDDRAAVGADPDIRSTILRVEPGRNGRFLLLVVRAYADLGAWWSIEAKLDTRDGSRADHVLALWNWDMSGAGCAVHEAGHPRDSWPVTFRQNGKTARCRLPIRLVEPDGWIRWRLVSHSSYDEGELERAPDTGWYG